MFEIYNFFIYFLVGFVITLVLNFGFGQLNINTTNFDYEKFSAYECGFDPFEHTRFSFDVRFYLIAIFYIIFDLEVIFFFPLSISVSYIYGSDYLFTFGFVFFLFLGVVYEFWKGKLDWSKGLKIYAYYSSTSAAFPSCYCYELFLPWF
jgi:NADH:ubiquinone oxidoreductase subunit 3 (subunit A)